MENKDNIVDISTGEITPSNRDKEIKIKDINAIIDSVGGMYTNLALSSIETMEILDILSPIVNKDTMQSLETKANGFSINLLELETDVLSIRESKDEIEKLIIQKENLKEDDPAALEIDIKLLPKFESLIYRVGTTTKEMESLLEYFLTNIKATTDSLLLNTKKKHEEITKKSENEKTNNGEE